MPKVCPVCSTTYPDTNAFCPSDGSTLRVVESAEGLIGTVVADRYLVTDLLGEGGMGKVYLARHVRLPQQAAIKILHPDLVRDPSSVARFNREASNASQIEQENVARVHDYGETSEGLVYLAMEYVPGVTLRSIIESEGPLPPRRTRELIRQIAAGLDAAHQLPRPLIHRDLKPDNVLVVRSPSGRERVKVVDFGIAKAVGSDDNGLTKTGFVVGTPEFMSPEQLLGEPVDARSDVYALALVAFQCLTGTLPFEMTTPERARLGRLLEAPRHLLDRTPGVSWPASLEALFDDALARDRDRRPDTAGAFAEEFAYAIDETWPDTAATAPRPTRTPAAMAAMVPTPPTGVPFAVPEPAPAEPLAALPPRVPRPPRPSSRAVPVALGLVLLAAGGGAVLFTRDGGADAAPSTGTPPAAVADTAPDSAATPRPTAVPSAAPGGGRSARDARAAARDSARAAALAAAPADGEASAATGDSAAIASRAVEGIARTLDGDGVEATRARTLADSLRGLLPRLGRDEQVRAYVGLVRASILTGDVAGACSAVRSATAAARRPAQQDEVKRLNEQLGCD